MGYELDTLKRIYSKTQGCCHLCHGKLKFKDYSRYDSDGAWEVEHSNPRANGGSDHLNNLFSAHKSCNRYKGTASTRSVRAEHGHKRAPLSKAKVEKIRSENELTGAVIGGALGFIIGGPPGAFALSLLGTFLGGDSSPRK